MPKSCSHPPDNLPVGPLSASTLAIGSHSLPVDLNNSELAEFRAALGLDLGDTSAFDEAEIRQMATDTIRAIVLIIQLKRRRDASEPPAP